MGAVPDGQRTGSYGLSGDDSRTVGNNTESGDDSEHLEISRMIAGQWQP